MTFGLYGHLFENTEADRADMAKIEAAVRGLSDQVATCGLIR